MDIYRLNRAVEELAISKTKLSYLLEKRYIPHIKKISQTARNARSSYYIPKIFIDYAATKLGLRDANKFKNVKESKLSFAKFANRKGVKVLAFSNLKGGVGKTSIATNVAYALALLNKRVLLVDMDSQANSSRYFANSYFNGSSIKTIFDSLSRKERVDRDYIHSFIHTVEFDNAALDLLPSELSLGRIVEFSRAIFTMPHKKLDDILKHVKDEYDFVVIDTPPTTGLSLHMSIYASDLLSIVTDAEDFSVNGLNELATEIREIEEETEKKIEIDSIFINKIKNSKIHDVYIEAIIQLAIEQKIKNVYTISDSVRFKEAQSLHIPLIEYKSELDKGLVLNESIIEYAIDKALEG